ncbi:exocyst complex component 7-like isoform X2 [Tubulanus polymorphus]|uniref:exocyst complex component 7-like isoform X2 n=1 Tax=Tubulanus polymorphus TaxID=672921 RepID=UPI003DA6C22F
MVDVPIKEIDLILAREGKNLNLLTESLERSNKMTKNMTSVLQSFDLRLRKLEENITPVYLETGNLQRRQENIEKTMVNLDHVIGLYHIAKDSEKSVRDGPSNGLEEYLSSMEKIQQAFDYFMKNSPGSPELSTVSHLLDVGRKSIEKEFKNLLARHSKPVMPTVVLNLIDNEQDEVIDAEFLPGNIDHLPERVIEDLLAITSWLLTHTQGDHDFTEVYAVVRSNNLIKSLQSLRDHIKKTNVSTGGNHNTQNSPLMSSKARKETPTRRVPSKRTPSNYFGRMSGTLKASMHSLDSSGIKRTPSFSTSEIKDDVLDVELDGYLVGISSLLRLIQSEWCLLCCIIPQTQRMRCFDLLVQQGLDLLVAEGDQIATTAKKSISKHDYSSLVSIFPVIKHLRIVRPEYDNTLQACQGSTKAKLGDLQAMLDTTGAKLMETFVDCIRNDPDKQSNMPRDGTVHELTSNVMMFLSQLLEYADTAGAMLVTQDASSLSPQQQAHKYKMKLSAYLSKVLSALGLNLNNKVDNYSDVTLRAIFMLNNYNHILKSMKRSGLLDIICLSNPDAEKLYDDKILEQKRFYSQSWSRVLHFIQDIHKALPYQKAQDLSKMKDKERQNIKDKFTGFNKEIEDLHRVQKGYAIPDMELRETLIHDNKQYITPVYEKFYHKYQSVNFTRNPEKYLKYNPTEVAEIIDRFFDSTA